MSVRPDRFVLPAGRRPWPCALPPRRRALLAHWSSPTTSTASANASVAVPHVTLAAAALVVVLVADKFVDAACSLNESPPPALCRRRPCCSPRRSRCRRCCRHHHLLLSRFLLLMCSCLLRCVQLMALPRWLVGRFRPLCTNVLAAARRASCLRGLAGGLFAFVSILLEVIVEEGSSSEVRPRQVEPIRCTRAAAECPCERADGQPVRADLARFFLAHAGTAGAFDKGDFRVRAPGGVVVSPLARARRAVTCESLAACA